MTTRYSETVKIRRALAARIDQLLRQVQDDHEDFYAVVEFPDGSEVQVELAYTWNSEYWAQAALFRGGVELDSTRHRDRRQSILGVYELKDPRLDFEYVVTVIPD